MMGARKSSCKTMHLMLEVGIRWMLRHGLRAQPADASRIIGWLGFARIMSGVDENDGVVLGQRIVGSVTMTLEMQGVCRDCGRILFSV